MLFRHDSLRWWWVVVAFRGCEQLVAVVASRNFSCRASVVSNNACFDRCTSQHTLHSLFFVFWWCVWSVHAFVRNASRSLGLIVA